MAVRDIIVWPDPALRQETEQIIEFSEKTRQLYRDLADTMHAYNGLGIASVQIGDPGRVYLVAAQLLDGDEGEEPTALINPEIVSTSEETITVDEGCLSFPGVYVPIERPVQAKVKALNLDGEWFEVEGDGLLARCLLHELDHLTGKLMVDFVGPLKKQMIKRRLNKHKKELELERDEASGALS